MAIAGHRGGTYGRTGFWHGYGYTIFSPFAYTSFVFSCLLSSLFPIRSFELVADVQASRNKNIIYPLG